MVLAREDLQQADRWEAAMVAKAERGADEEQVEGLETVFEAEREKVRNERRTWVWVAVGSGALTVAGVGVVWGVTRSRRWSSSQGPASFG